LLKTGTILIQEKIVNENETAINVGSGSVHLFSTPMMIAFMENTAFNLVQPELNEGETTVGTEVFAKHIKSNRPGDKVVCEAILDKIEGRKLFFTLLVTSEGEVVGKGTHVRYIVKDKG
jgi:fluoroacetyl-CoA thioesterase